MRYTFVWPIIDSLFSVLYYYAQVLYKCIYSRFTLLADQSKSGTSMIHVFWLAPNTSSLFVPFSGVGVAALAKWPAHAAQMYRYAPGIPYGIE